MSLEKHYRIIIRFKNSVQLQVEELLFTLYTSDTGSHMELQKSLQIMQNLSKT